MSYMQMGCRRNERAEKIAIVAVEEGKLIPDSSVVMPTTSDSNEAYVQSRRSSDLR